MPYRLKNDTVMGFFSIIGRLLFAYIFILSAWEMFNEFGVDGGTFAHEIAPNVASFQIFLASKIGYRVPEINVKHVTLATIVVKAVGAILFVFGSTIGAYMMTFYLLIMTPVFYNFYNYKTDDAEFHSSSRFCEGFSILCIFFRHGLNLYDFYSLLQCYSIAGALVFFIGMKNELPRKAIKKKPRKTKTA